MEGNIKIDKSGKYIEIVVNSKIFPISCIIRTLNDFIDRYYVAMDKSSSEKILVRLTPHEKIDLKKLGYEFNTQLVASFVEGSQSRMPEDIKNVTRQTALGQSQTIPRTSTRQRSFVLITRKCINDCLFCTEKGKMQWEEPTIKELKEILASDCKSFPSIVFTGGEPSLRKDIFELIKYAKSLGYSVRLFTNGRLFSNPRFSEKIAKAGLDAVLIPVHSHLAKTHDQITQRPGSFEQTILGIKNLTSNNIKVQVKIIPNKINYKTLPNLASFLASLPYVNVVAMDMLTISGNALKNKNIISIKLSNMVPYIEKALDILTRAGKEIYVGSLPLCLIKSKYWKYIQNDRLSKEINVGTDKDKMCVIRYAGEAITSICQSCLLKDKCPGTWPSYFRVYGYSELKPVVGA